MTAQLAPTRMTLNPLAAEFVPFLVKRKFTGWGRDGFAERKAEAISQLPLQPGEGSYNILDAPDEVYRIFMA